MCLPIKAKLFIPNLNMVLECSNQNSLIDTTIPPP
jgi:hypothetical protein